MSGEKICSSGENIVHLVKPSRPSNERYVPSKSPTTYGGGGGGGGMDRVIKLEHEVSYIKEGIGEIKSDVKLLMRGGIAAIVMVFSVIIGVYLHLNSDIKELSSNLGSDIRDVSINERKTSESVIRIEGQLMALDANIVNMSSATESALDHISNEIKSLNVKK